MKRIWLVLVALAMMFGFASVCLGQDEGAPELMRESNIRKGAKAMNPLILAEKKFLQRYPECYTIDGGWIISEGGYTRTYNRGKGRYLEAFILTVSHEGVMLYFDSNINQYVRME